MFSSQSRSAQRLLLTTAELMLNKTTGTAFRGRFATFKEIHCVPADVPQPSDVIQIDKTYYLVVDEPASTDTKIMIVPISRICGFAEVTTPETGTIKQGIPLCFEHGKFYVPALSCLEGDIIFTPADGERFRVQQIVHGKHTDRLITKLLTNNP